MSRAPHRNQCVIDQSGELAKRVSESKVVQRVVKSCYAQQGPGEVMQSKH